MAKEKSVFVCQQCGEDFPKWFGKCPNCGEWNSLVETKALTKSARSKGRVQSNVKPIKLSEVKVGKSSRVLTKISELDRVLGGGVVAGQVILLAGEPGIGKSTILLQISENMAMPTGKQGKVLYVSGEESAEQIKIRADRLNTDCSGVSILSVVDIDEVLDQSSEMLDKGLDLLVIDSIQTMTTADLSGTAGSVGQVRECASRVVSFAKTHGVPVFLVGHATKVGTVAGPATLAHVVDSVLWFEGERDHNLRLLRSTKNRFGPTDEVGVFSMEEKGLSSVSDVGKMFLGEEREKVSGSVVGVTMEGTRAMCVEVQSLVVRTNAPYPKRVSQGIDGKRLEMLLSVLMSRCGLKLYERDVFVNVVGGMKINDPGLDLAVCMSVASAFLGNPVSGDCAFVGEVGLLGEVREASNQKKRIMQAKSQGFKTAIGGKGILSTLLKKYIR